MFQPTCRRSVPLGRIIPEGTCSSTGTEPTQRKFYYNIWYHFKITILAQLHWSDFENVLQ